jgi:hypothetical protein
LDVSGKLDDAFYFVHQQDNQTFDVGMLLTFDTVLTAPESEPQTTASSTSKTMSRHPPVSRGGVLFCLAGRDVLDQQSDAAAGHPLFSDFIYSRRRCNQT